jgi:hypothetical protein
VDVLGRKHGIESLDEADDQQGGQHGHEHVAHDALDGAGKAARLDDECEHGGERGDPARDSQDAPSDKETGG